MKKTHRNPDKDFAKELDQDHLEKIYARLGRPSASQRIINIAGYAFLCMGVALLAVSFYSSRFNLSLADWVATVFIQFLPGVILFISAFKTLKNH